MPRRGLRRRHADLGEQRLERSDPGRDVTADQRAARRRGGGTRAASRGRRPRRRRGSALRPRHRDPRRPAPRRGGAARGSRSSGLAWNRVERGAPQLCGLIERVRGLATQRGFLGVARGALGNLGEQEVAEQELRVARLARGLECKRDPARAGRVAAPRRCRPSTDSRTRSWYGSSAMWRPRCVSRTSVATRSDATARVTAVASSRHACAATSSEIGAPAMHTTSSTVRASGRSSATRAESASSSVAPASPVAPASSRWRRISCRNIGWPPASRDTRSRSNRPAAPGTRRSASSRHSSSVSGPRRVRSTGEALELGLERGVARRARSRARGSAVRRRRGTARATTGSCRRRPTAGRRS